MPRMFMFVSVALFSVACYDGKQADTTINNMPDTSVKVELVCPESFCGTITDKNTGITTDCGSCKGNQICGGNGEANICSSDCSQVLSANSQPSLSACDFAFGKRWGAGFGSQVELPFACNYANPANCQPALNEIGDAGTLACADDICLNVWCCISNADAGISPLLPNSIADSDGGTY